MRTEQPPSAEAFALDMDAVWRGVAELALTMQTIQQALELLAPTPGRQPWPAPPSDDGDAWLRAYA